MHAEVLVEDIVVGAPIVVVVVGRRLGLGRPATAALTTALLARAGVFIL
jgi:hypothetical protein